MAAPTQQPGRLAAVTRTTIISHRVVGLARAAWLALSALALGLFIVAVPARYHELLQSDPGFAPAFERLGLTNQFTSLYFLACELAVPVIFTLVAGLIFWRKSNDWMTLYLGLDLIIVGATTPPVLNALLPGHPGWRLPIDFLVALGLALSLVGYYIFPDFQFVPRWTRWLAVACATWITGRFLAALVAGFTMPPVLTTTIYFGLYAAGIYAQIFRYRRVSGPTQRQQTKWAVLGFVPAFLGFCAFNLTPLFVPQFAVPGYDRLIFLLVGAPLYILTLIMAPIALLIAVLRYRLMDIDFLLSRSLVYGSLTAGLGVLFLGSVLLLQGIFPRLTGGQQSGLALAVSALVMGALFQPARRRLQTWLDRRFYPETAAPTEVGLPLAVSDANPGMHIGPYEVLEIVGRGGMAQVFKARHTGLGRLVALKILSPSLAAENDFRQRFAREARTVAGLKHPNIVEVFDFGQSAGHYYMAMEYIAGRDLGVHLRQNGPLPLEVVRAIAAGIAAALDYAHGQGVVHRDVKPSNVIIEPQPAAGEPAGQAPFSLQHSTFRPVLTDFGIVRLVGPGGGTRLTTTGAIGTLEYIAPEQIMAAKSVDGRADIYALGVMVFEMLTGRLPFVGDNPGALVLAHLQQPAPDPRELRPELPAEAAEAVLRALAKEPAGRFAVAQELAAALH